ncbi:imidazole glycerol phosphate synthase subunit HisH [Amylibacter sp.]|nr:imidazole glycerol phosphate synthase subunit HisH [Amylibacter sp.]MDC0607872.1 imidazole glycerol phosphate synthase subunit HisH [Amylibacter sp.]
MITIIDTELSNVSSVRNMLSRLRIASEITNDPSKIEKASKIILPGVGSFDAGMHKLKSLNLDKVLSEVVVEKKCPILGICLGMQLMLQGSDEGVSEGLGWVAGRCLHFSNEDVDFIPNMGWCETLIKRKIPLFSGIGEVSRFYHVHSYYPQLKDKTNVICETLVDSFAFTSGFQLENIYGLQFHPEKSNKNGFILLSNFAKI